MVNFSPASGLGELIFFYITWRASARAEIIASAPLLLSRFRLLLGLSFQLSGMVKADRMMELKQNLSLARYLSAREMYMYWKRKDIFKLAELMASLTASCCLTLSALKLMFLYSICTLRQWIKFSILSSLFHWNRCLLLCSGSHIVFWFSALTEILFRLHQFFQILRPLWPGWKY